LPKQLLVLAGIVLAVTILALLSRATPPFALPDGDDQAARLAYWAHWLLLPGLTLAAGVGLAGAWRFLDSEAIDGTPAPKSAGLEITLRYNRNTLEQLVLAAIAWAGLALALPHERLVLVPALAVLFVFARALFWVGYLIAPWARAAGFALTFYPTVAALFWLTARLAQPGP